MVTTPAEQRQAAPCRLPSRDMRWRHSCRTRACHSCCCCCWRLILAWGSAVPHAAGGGAEGNAAAWGCWGGSHLLETCSSRNENATLPIGVMNISSIFEMLRHICNYVPDVGEGSEGALSPTICTVLYHTVQHPTAPYQIAPYCNVLQSPPTLQSGVA